MKQLIIFSLEPIESRYTKQWFTHLPELFKEKIDDCEIIQIDGDTKSNRPTPGAFLDFEATNIWKSEQVIKFFKMMSEGLIQDDAYILFTDFWNPCAIQLKYTKDLCKKNWTLIGIAHAGSYDPNDFLGRIPNKNWSLNFECSLYWCYDKLWFATNYHINLFASSVSMLGTPRNRFLRSGFPMEYIPKIFNHDPLNHDYKKEKLIVFPARIAPEKQPEIFEKLAELMPEYKFVMCCKENMTKEEYHDTLKRAKLMLSFSLQETLGITQYEGLAAKCFSLVPDHLSYSEMYPTHLKSMFTYPAKWILPHYEIKYDKLVERIRFIMNGFEMHFVNEAFHFQTDNYFKSNNFIDWINNN
jgi:hypothetical protein